MPQIEDFLKPLNEGVWEVSIPKESITVPLGEDWKKSAINVPSPKTIASFRKGQYHVHETKDEWKVHLDRYDPKKHPVMHLLDDAPLLLMIGDTFLTLVSNIRRNESADTKTILKTQTSQWHLQVIAGLFLFLVGLTILNAPLTAFTGITLIVIPLLIIISGVIITLNGLINLKTINFSKGDMPWGLCILAAGIIAYYLPVKIWIIFLSTIISVWMLASAFLLLIRVGKGRSAVPEGFISRLIIGLLSLLFVFITYLSPVSLIAIMMFLLGLIILLLGIMLVINGIRLGKMMNHQKPESIL